MNIQIAVNWPLREERGSLILGQSLAGGFWGRYCTYRAVYTIRFAEPCCFFHCS
jgi:hypothetical protein